LKRGGRAHFAPKTPQSEPVSGGFQIGSKSKPSYPSCFPFRQEVIQSNPPGGQQERRFSSKRTGHVQPDRVANPAISHRSNVRPASHVISQTADGGNLSARRADWDAPIRISQLADQPTVGQPGTGARGIEPVLPPPADGPGDNFQDDRRLPFQQLPAELIMTPPSEATKKQFDRFIPKIVDPQNTLNLLVGHPRILTFADWAVDPKIRLYLPDESVARWDIISDTEVAVVGTAPGTTVLTIWFNDPTAKGGKRVLSYQVRVFEDPAFRESLKQIENEINKLFPDSHVRLSIVRDRLVVQGEAKDTIEAAQILSLLAQTRRGRRGPTRDGGNVREFRESQVFIDQDLFRLEDEAALRRSLLDPNALIDSGIVNLLRIPGEQQVMLRVSVAEINRSALRSIGADMQIGSGDVSFLSLVAETGFMGTPGFGNLLVDKPDFRLALRALRRVNLARVLAEPNLVALNGRSATFFAGDRVPLPDATAGFGGVGQSVRFDNVGVTLSFTPFIVERNRIRLTVLGRVSTLDESGGQANIGGTNVSTQNARTFQTTVDLRDGETMAMAGLILTTLRSEGTRIPFFGDLPLIGTLFSDKSNAYTEQELVILVTPELAHPLKACDTPPLPGADVFEPTDVEFYLGNRLESLRTRDYRSTIRTDYARVRTGEDCFCDPFIIGPSGHSYGCCNHQPGFHNGVPSTGEEIVTHAPSASRLEAIEGEAFEE